MKSFLIENIEYYTRRNPSGYGYEIISKTPIGDNRYRYSCLFRSMDKELVNSKMDELIKTKQVPEFPDTSNEVDNGKVLVYRSKHFTHHYSVPSLDIFYKVLRKILKDEYGGYVDNMKPNEPKNETGITCIEDLDKIQIESVREEISQKWDKYQKRMVQYRMSLREYDNLKLVIETSEKGDPKSAISEYEGDCWELVDLEIIK